MSSVTANVAHINQQIGCICEISPINQGRGYMTHGRCRSSSSNWPTWQLYGKYGHFVTECWHMFDETFTPTRAQPNLTKFQGTFSDKHEAVTCDSQSISMMAKCACISLPIELEKQAWFVDLGASHHLTPHDHFLHTKKPYVDHNHICIENGQYSAINYVGLSCVIPKSKPTILLLLMIYSMFLT